MKLGRDGELEKNADPYTQNRYIFTLVGTRFGLQLLET